ncbi:MAG: sulfatase [Bacteroidetes bacterium]|nr:sulfatase [Bacteroidota bacterium]
MNSKLFLIGIFVSLQLFSQEKKPNVLFILADDLGINALNCYGNEIVETPNIDKLYSEGMHFTNGYAADPTCAPSRAAIMTGQYAPRTNIYRVVDRYKISKNAEDMRKHMKFLPPDSNHLYSDDNGLDPSNFNIAQAFKSNGYKTAAFGKWHLGKGKSGMHNIGFDEAIETKNHYDFSTYPKQDDYNSKVYNADYCTEKGIEFIEKSVKEDKPFFLYMPYYLVHAPFQPKEKYVKYFKEKFIGTDYDHKNVIEVVSMIKSLDDSVGELMDAIEKMGLEENTIIVFTSDNGHYKVKGNNMFALPYKGNKGDAWEGGIRVPYIFKWKHKIKGNSMATTPTIHVDLYPTLAGLTDLKLSENHILDGKSLKNILLDNNYETETKAMIWFYTNYSGFNSKNKTFISKWTNVIQEKNYKLLEDVDSGIYQLYNLEKDPFETKDIYSEQIEISKKLIEKLNNWKKNTLLPAPRLNPEYILK